MYKKLFYWFCKIVFKIYCPLKTHGLENIPATPFIICSNHCSHIDSVALMISFRMPFSRFAMVAAQDYFFEKKKSRVFSVFLNLIPLNRKSTAKTIAENISLCRHSLIEKRQNLIIYPEGTRSLSGQMNEFKRGAAMLAVELGVPILPVYIQGAYEALPKGRFFLRPRRISISIGKPLQRTKVSTETKRRLQNLKLYTSLTEELETSIHHLKEQHHVHSA